MNRSESQLRTNPRIVPPDLLLRFGYAPNGGIEFDSAAETLSFYQGGTPRVDISSFGLAVRNGEGLIVGHTAQIAVQVGTPEFQVLGTGLPDSSGLFSRSTTSSAAPSLNFNKSRNAAIGSFTIVQDGDGLGTLRFTGDDGVDYKSIAADIIVEVDGTPGAGDMPGRIILKTTADGAEIPTEALRIDSAQNVQMRKESSFWIGPSGASAGFVDANTTVGLVVNQEGNTDSVITAKKSSVAHGLTSSGPYAVETDTFFSVKNLGGNGGADIAAIANNGSLGVAMRLNGFGRLGETTSTITSGALMSFRVSQHNGSNALSDMGAGGNAFAWQARQAGAHATRMILKANGDLHITNTTLVALDDEDDIALVRAYQRESSNGIGIAMSKWDAHMHANADDLVRVGVWSSEHDFTIQQRMNDLLGGAIWQQHTAHMSLVERVDVLVLELGEARQQLAALTA